MQHAFEGIRVIELGGYIVSSLCATLLGEMGADVIKIESQQGDGLRPQLGAFQGWNRGKRGIVVDLRVPEGQRILHRLVERADVLVQNLRHGVAERWAADYETLSRLNPRLVYLAMPGYGQSGPYISMPAFDPLLQARSGAMAAQGGEGSPPVYHHVPISDNSGAMLGAFAVALALLQRRRTGKGQFVHGSLLNSSMAIQSGEFVDFPGRPETPRLDYLGEDATYRMYPCRDGHIFLGCRDDATFAALCRALGRGDMVDDERFATAEARRRNGAALAVALGLLFEDGTVGGLVAKLQAAGVPCAPVNYGRDVILDEQIEANSLVAEHLPVDIGFEVKQRGLVVKLSETPGKVWRAAPGLGEHTAEVLAELGYSPEEIARLQEEHVIICR